MYVIYFEGRAKKRIDDLERRLEICRRNYVQWGGKLAEDCRRIKQDRESARFSSFCN